MYYRSTINLNVGAPDTLFVWREGTVGEVRHEYITYMNVEYYYPNIVEGLPLLLQQGWLEPCAPPVLH